MRSAGRFAGRVALVTGSSRGIGRSIALALAREGADVIVAAKTVQPDPRLPGTIGETAAEIEALGRRALAVPVDLRDSEAAEALAARATAEFGGVDILVNNAGAVHFGDVGDWTLKRFDLVMSVNLRASFLLTRALLPGLRERALARRSRAGGGDATGAATHSIVAMISPPVHPGASPHKAPYLISKAGMTMMALALAEEEREHAIAAFSLWPVTAIETAATIRHGLGAREQWRRPEIVADALVALCARPLERSTGRAWTDEEVLREEGVADLSVYDCVLGSNPPPLSLQWVSE